MKRFPGLLAATVLLAACTTPPSVTRPQSPQPSAPTPPVQPSAPATSSQSSPYACTYAALDNGRFYKDDGPLELPDWLNNVPDARPISEPLHRFANRPYTVLGQSFTPLTTPGDYRMQGVGSWYGRKFHGQKTSSGEVYDMFAMSAASPVLPIPSYARVTNVHNGRSVVVRVNDRGPFHKGRVIDLSFLAACRLGYAQAGSGEVVVESLRADGSVANAQSHVTLATPAAPATPQAVSQAAVSATPSGLHYVQLGAFGEAANAEAFRTRIASQLPPSIGTPSIQPANGVFRVRLGPYPGRAQAESVVAELQRSHDLAAVVAR
ncbi:septal ring lytic transglycosylase RlpA family protein [Chitinibacteraceae bacterium HSL-7]